MTTSEVAGADVEITGVLETEVVVFRLLLEAELMGRLLEAAVDAETVPLLIGNGALEEGPALEKPTEIPVGTKVPVGTKEDGNMGLIVDIEVLTTTEEVRAVPVGKGTVGPGT